MDSGATAWSAGEPQRAPSRIRLTVSDLPPLALAVGEWCAARGIRAYLVGGAVRDLLLGGTPVDLDIAVGGDAIVLGGELTGALRRRAVVLDASRGVVRLACAEGECAGSLDLSSLREDIAADMARRDFTMDAMAVRLDDLGSRGPALDVVDPLGGELDLRAGVVRAVSEASLESDPARLLRGPRLAAQLGFRIEEGTAAAIRRHAALLGGVAPERVRDEFLKLLAQPSPAASLRALDGLDLLCRVVPELEDARGVAQPPEHRWDVLEHCVETAGAVERVLGPARGRPPGCIEGQVPTFDGMESHFAAVASDGHTRATLLKLAGLLHDVAKPATRTVEPGGRMRFLGHHALGAEMAVAILRRLRVSERGADMVRRMVEGHLRPAQMAQKGELPTPRAAYRFHRDLGDVAVDTLYLNLADCLAARGPALQPEEWGEHCRLIGHILEAGGTQQDARRSRGLINGDDIMRVLRMGPGPVVGRLLEMVREAEASGEVTTGAEALALAERLRSGHDRA